MCLSTITNKPRRLSAFKKRIGWKVFSSYNSPGPTAQYGKPLYFDIRGGRAWEGKWLTAKTTKTIKSTYGGTYQSGFHIYLKKPTPLYLAPIRKVKFSDVIVTGEQHRREIVVAKYIWIGETDNTCTVTKKLPKRRS